MYTDPQNAARAWAEANGWGTEPAPNDLGLAFFFISAPGTKKEKKHVAMYGSWPTFAGRIMSSGLIRQEADGWTFD